MKNRAFLKPLLAIACVTILALSAMSVSGQDSSTATTAAAGTTVASQAGQVQLPYGASDVLQLTRAGVSDDTIVAFVGNSGNLYNLNQSKINYLREQGVSANVITAMLEQRLTEGAATPKDQAVVGAPPSSYADTNNADYTPPAPGSIEMFDVSPTSTVFIIHSGPQFMVNDNGYPSYGGYSGFPVLPGGFVGHSYGGGFHGRGGTVGGGNFHRGGGFHPGGDGSHREGGGFHGGGGFRGGGGSFHGSSGSHGGGHH